MLLLKIYIVSHVEVTLVCQLPASLQILHRGFVLAMQTEIKALKGV